MIQLTTGTSNCQFKEVNGLYFISINDRTVLRVSEADYVNRNYNLLESVYQKWLRANYPSFWENPIRWLFGGQLKYSGMWDK